MRMDPVEHEQNLITDHLTKRMNAGVDPDVLAEALNTMMLEMVPQEDDQPETVH